MQPRVSVILVARNGAQFLPRTLSALAAQTRKPDAVVFVDAGSTDASIALLKQAANSSATPSQAIATRGRSSFGGAIAHAVQVAESTGGDDDWLWLLGHDSAPDAGALSRLLGAVEVAPSVAVAGPKLMRWDAADVISNFGETMTRFGRSLPLVTDELDQAQYDLQSDLLGVAANGMLVRRRVWNALGGFDPALPSVDAALDFCVRVRLAGNRVVGVPSARVASAGSAELFGRRSIAAGRHNRLQRSAQLHRRLAYAPAITLPIHWLSLMPLALMRSLGQLLAKRPGLVGGEFSAAIAAAFDGRVVAARRSIRRTRELGWAVIAPLRATSADLRELKAQERSAAAVDRPVDRERPGFFSGGGAWVVLLMAVIGAIAFGGYSAAQAVTGGGLVPLSATAAELWSHIGYGWRDVGGGLVGSADPFASLLAILGSLTFWSPSFSIVLLYLTALPLAALGAWWCAARLSTRGWAPGVAAIAWALAPPFLSSLSEGQLGAVIAHLLLPVLATAVLLAARSWSLAAVAALLFAAIAAASPVLVPALVVCLVGWIVARPASIHRLIGIPLPAAALFAPLIVEQFSRGTPLALLVDPGVTVVRSTPSGIQLVIGSAAGDGFGLASVLAQIGVPASAVAIVVIVLLAPLGTLALLAVFLPGARRSIPALLVALLGLVTALLGNQLLLASVGPTATPIWPGAALSLYWLGLVAGATGALGALARRAAIPAIVLAVTSLLLAVPFVSALSTGTSTVNAGSARLLPAFVTAEAANQADLGTLKLVAQPGGSLAATVQRGAGTTLDEQSTLQSTRTELSESERRIAVLAGNIASRSGFDVAAELDALQIGFVLLPPSATSVAGTLKNTPGSAAENAAENTVADAAAEAVRQRTAEALDGYRILTPIGDTAFGFLWHYEGLADGTAPSGPGPLDTTLGVAIFVGQGIVFGLTLMLAFPTTRRRRVRSARVDGALVDGARPVAARPVATTSAESGVLEADDER